MFRGSVECMAIRPVARAALVGCCVLCIASCSVSARISQGQRSSIEQILLARSLERSIAQLDTAKLTGKTVGLEVYGLTADRQFAEKLVGASLQQRGVKLATDASRADVTVKVFLTALGIDTGSTLIGLPAFNAPVLNAPIPEIALFKSERNRGHTQVRLYAFDQATQRLVEKSRPVDGRSKFDEYTLLLVINFTVDDLDQPPANAAAD